MAAQTALPPPPTPDGRLLELGSSGESRASAAQPTLGGVPSSMTSCPGTNDIWLDGFGFGVVVRVRTNASRAGPRLLASKPRVRGRPAVRAL